MRELICSKSDVPKPVRERREDVERLGRDHRADSLVGVAGERAGGAGADVVERVRP